MRKLYRVILAGALLSASTTTVSAQDHPAFIQGFGGVRLASGPLGSMSTGSFGGNAGVDLTPNIQALGEVGRLSNVLPSTLQTLLSFAPGDFGVSAWYGQGGVRLTGSSGAVRPYVETLAGMARLRTGLSGFGAFDPYINTALGFLTTTRPIASAGAGVVLQGGPIVIDAGYRFNRVFAGDSLTGFFTGGDVDMSQIRVGLGVRF